MDLRSTIKDINDSNKDGSNRYNRRIGTCATQYELQLISKLKSEKWNYILPLTRFKNIIL